MSIKIKVGKFLDALGIYSPIKKLLVKISQPHLLLNDIEIWVDILKTRKLLKKWSNDRAGLQTTSPDFGNVLIISRTNIPFLAKAHALLAIGLQKRGYKTYILCSSNSRWARRYYSIFSLQDLIHWDKCLTEFSSDLSEVENIVNEFLSSKPKIQDFKVWQFHGVSVGKLALSTMIRRELKGQFDLNDPIHSKLVRKWLVETINNVLVAERLLDQYSISKMIVRDAGYIPNGAIYEVGLNRDIDAIRFEHAQMMGQWMVKRYNLNSRGQALFSLSSETWEHLREVPLTPEQDQALTNDFIERYDPESKRDLYQYQEGKKKLSPEEIGSLLRLDQRKKTAVIFAHISWDANFFDGEDLYDDFEHWLVETVKIACENPHLNWIVKLHPANVYKLKREGRELSEESEMTALRRLGALPAHIKIMHADTPVNTWSLFPLIDYGLTVRGTIGMELPCFGVPTITAGTGRYSGYGITIDPPTRGAYRDCLMALHSIPRLSPDQIELARRHAYWVFLHRQASFDEFSNMSTQVMKKPNHPLHHNLMITAGTHKDFVQAPRFNAFLDWITKDCEPDFIFQQNPGL
jgi:hypothetical protein